MYKRQGLGDGGAGDISVQNTDLIATAAHGNSQLAGDHGLAYTALTGYDTIDLAHMGVGRAAGKNKAEEAARMAISSPLLETSIAGARGVIINITSSPDIGLEDVETAAGLITQSAHPDANIIWGTAFDENLSDEMRVTVVATGFDNKVPDALRASLSNAAGAAASTPSAVFSYDVTAANNAAKQQPAAAANSAAKPVEEESSDNRYYDELLAILNKRK